MSSSDMYRQKWKERLVLLRGVRVKLDGWARETIELCNKCDGTLANRDNWRVKNVSVA